MTSLGSSARFQRECVGSAESECSAIRFAGLDRNRHLQFHERVTGQGIYANSGANMFSGFAEYIHDQVGGAVDHLGGFRKAGNGVHVAVNTNDFTHSVEGAQVSSQNS